MLSGNLEGEEGREAFLFFYWKRQIAEEKRKREKIESALPSPVS